MPLLLSFKKVNVKQVMPTLLVATLLFMASACGPRNRTQDKLAEDSATARNLGSNLTFKDVTLEQVDEQGRLLWKVRAKQANYSKDQKIAQIQNPEGELFQDGKLVYKISAKAGEVEQDGKKIFLKGDITATAIQDKAVLRGKELEWRPQEDILIVRNNLTGTHAQAQVTAKEARVFSRARRMELRGQVVAITRDPNLLIKTDHVVWLLAQQLMTTGAPLNGKVTPVQIDRFVNKKVTGRAIGDQSEVNLKAKTAILKQNVQVLVSDPRMQLTGQSAFWDFPAQIIRSDNPVTVVNYDENVTMSANQGQMDLEKRVVYLNGNVQGNGEGKGERKPSRLDADQLTWFVRNKEVEAIGNVVYHQADPPLHVTGPKAFGKLSDQTIVVSGGRGQVVTNIVPQRLPR